MTQASCPLLELACGKLKGKIRYRGKGGEELWAQESSGWHHIGYIKKISEGAWQYQDLDNHVVGAGLSSREAATRCLLVTLSEARASAN